MPTGKNCCGRSLRHALTALAVVAAASCSETAPLSPSSGRSPASGGQTIGTTTVALAGLVTDTEGLPLARAAVGSMHQGYVLTDARGRYTGPLVQVGQELHLVAEKSGFVPAGRRVVATGEDINFQLEKAERAWSNPYRLTFRAAPSCTLPAEAMVRRYQADVVVEGGTVRVVLDDAIFVAWGEAGFTGEIGGDGIRFQLTDSYESDYQFVELWASNEEYAVVGTAYGVLAEDRIAATLNGRVTIRTWAGHDTLATCVAPDHRLEFTR